MPSHVASITWFYWVELCRSPGEHCGRGMIWLRWQAEGKGLSTAAWVCLAWCVIWEMREILDFSGRVLLPPFPPLSLPFLTGQPKFTAGSHVAACHTSKLPCTQDIEVSYKVWILFVIWGSLTDPLG